MVIERVDDDFTVCQVADYSLAPLADAHCFIGKTDAENSLVCLTRHVPANAMRRSDGWKAFRIQGVLDFSLVGVLANIASVLAESGIAIFAVSTFNTDYVFVKAADFERALAALEAAGIGRQEPVDTGL